jgi:hypothetical protein
MQVGRATTISDMSVEKSLFLLRQQKEIEQKRGKYIFTSASFPGQLA